MSPAGQISVGLLFWTSSPHEYSLTHTHTHFLSSSSMDIIIMMYYDTGDRMVFITTTTKNYRTFLSLGQAGTGPIETQL